MVRALPPQPPVILFRLLLPIAAVVLVIWLLARVARPASLCRFEVRSGRTGMRGELPLRSRAEVLEFFDELGLPDGAVVGVRRDGGSLRIDFNLAVPSHLQQRIRNFLMLRP